MPQLIRQEQLRKPDDPDDQLTGSEVSNTETSAANQEEFWNGVLSQFKRIIHGSDTGNWHDDPETVFGESATLAALVLRSGFHENQLLYHRDGTPCLDRRGIIMRLSRYVPT